MRKIIVRSLILISCMALASIPISGRAAGLKNGMNNPVLGLQKESAARSPWLVGFNKEIFGETIIYHSPQPDVNSALLVRSLNKEQYIEWETGPLPEDYPKDFVTFIWLAGIDVNPDSHKFELYLNNEKWFSFSNPKDASQKIMKISGKDGSELDFRVTLVDKYGDFMGYVFLKVPKNKFSADKPLLVRVVGESAGSRAWYMTFKHRVEPKIAFFSEQAILRKADKPQQSLRAEIVHLGEPAKVVIKAEDIKTESKIDFGFNLIRFSVPAVKVDKELAVEIQIGNEQPKKQTILLHPVKKKEIYVLHHSHVDIGYTHVQTEVEKMQWKNLEQAVELAGASQGYPEGARFKWNTEVLWALDGYMQSASEENRAKMINAVRQGWIGLDGLYANELTALCRPEELMRLLENAREASETFGVRVEAAMISDIPGYSWGLIPVLAQSGIRYLSIGPNSGHRIGHTLSQWADRPFYWVSPSGQEKVLCWVHGKGYSWFHTGLGYADLKARLNEKPISEYLSQLEASNYPYDIVCFRYNIGSDNGPPDTELANIVKSWNEKYISPRLIIATTAEMFRAFEQKYKDSLPVVRGDFTGYWEDGAASSALETALARQAAERLIQAEALWAMKNPQSFPALAFSEAWRNILLYDEHTWGSWNSISEPESDFTRQQWKIKQSFALDAERQSKELLEAALNGQKKAADKIEAIDVYNTNSWHRTDVVFIPAERHLAGELIKDEDGNPIPCQLLSTGELAVLVKDVPALGAKRLLIENRPVYMAGKAKALGTILDNGLIKVKIDETTGAISSFEAEGISENLVNQANDIGLNDYFYVSGRNPSSRQRNGKVKIEVKEKGPLVASFLVQSEAPGCNSLKREIRVIDGLRRLDIIDIIDKKNIYEQEAVHLAFPFNVPEGQMQMDLAWGNFRPEYDQLAGSCKNYFTIQHWVDISNQRYGVTWATIDAPLVEVGDITADPVVVGWKKKVEPSQTIYSYLMNNYWETNYKASQEGPTVFIYSILPHGLFNPAAAERFGIECSQPLVVANADLKNPRLKSFLKIEQTGVIVTSLKPSKDGKAIIIRLFNASGSPEQVKILWANKQPQNIFISSPFEDRAEKIKETVFIPAYGIITLFAEDFK